MRPERPFTRITEFRTKQIEGQSDAVLKGELRSVNALYSLLDDRYSKKVRLLDQAGATATRSLWVIVARKELMRCYAVSHTETRP